MLECKRMKEHHFEETFSHWKHSLAVLRNKLLAGVAVAVPIVVTIWVLNLAYSFIRGISQPWLSKIRVTETLTLGQIPSVAFIVTMLMLVGLGFMATNVLGRRLIERIEAFLLRIPLVATIYAGVKQVIDSVSTLKSTEGFKRVVYVEYPAPGCRLLGFVTGQFVERSTGRSMTSVFLPTAPNPMTGFVMVTESEKVIACDLTLEEATKLVISCGIIYPR